MLKIGFQNPHSTINSYKFNKTGYEWYIDLPEYIEKGGSIGDLQMVEGADKMLDMMAGEEKSVTLLISDNQFDGAELLILIEKCDPYIGGGYYLLKNYDGKEINRKMWLCQVTEFVFGNLPEQIFLKKEQMY